MGSVAFCLVCGVGFFNGWSVGMLDMSRLVYNIKAMFCLGNFIWFYYRCSLYPVTKPVEE